MKTENNKKSPNTSSQSPATSPEIAISVKNLSKKYRLYDSPQHRLREALHPFRKKYHRDFWALKDVSFEVKKGETLGIIGKNGSGKSTLLQMVCGVLQPTEGAIDVNGKISALLELGAGFNPEFTGRENVYLNGAIKGFTREEMVERFQTIADFADIGDFIDQPVKTYSSGMYVRLAFAAAINVDPDIFVVDEALAVGDGYFVHRCMLRFHQMREQKKTILLVTHDASAVKSLCSRAIWIDNGAIESIGESSEVADRYLANLFKRQIVVSKTVANPIETIGLLATNTEKDFKENPGAIPHESKIPNIDRRLGDQACNIIGVCLYNRFMVPIRTTPNDSEIILRMTIRNNSLDNNVSLYAGYIFRNWRGEELASTNTKIESVDIGSCLPGKFMTVVMSITLPLLYPGTYSFSPTAGYISSIDGDLVLGDRVENAIVFEISSAYRIDAYMKFKNKITVEAEAK